MAFFAVRNEPAVASAVNSSDILGRFSKGPATRELRYKIDSIRIRRNWRTKDKIIMQELEIMAGDSVTSEQIKKAISRIWNIGNFSRVSYQIDSLKDKRTLLSIIAQDAVTIMPDLSVKGNRKEYLITAGINDNNFLGRNIDLGIAGSFGTNAHYANIRVGIPRQLLYRNMTLRGGFVYGATQRVKYSMEEPAAGTAYMQNSLNVSLGNPWHTDYHYTFSPDVSIGYFSHNTDSSLLTADVLPEEDYHAQYLTFSVSEFAGLINKIRHQEDGYLVYIGLGYGVSLNGENPGYFTLGLGGRYCKLLNRIIQLSANLSTGYTTAELASLINYLGPDQVKGITTGERWGKAIWSANAGVRFTYINRDWFAMEHSLFVNAGNAETIYAELFLKTPLFSAGTGVRFMVPVVPWLGITFYYAYRGDSKHWYSMEF